MDSDDQLWSLLSVWSADASQSVTEGYGGRKRLGWKIVRLGSKQHYPLSHLTGPGVDFEDIILQRASNNDKVFNLE